MSEVDKTEYINVFEALNVTGVEYKKGDVILNEDDLVDSVCIIEYGSVRGEKPYNTGDLHIVEMHERDDFFALEEAVSKIGAATMNYVCNEDSMIVYVSMNAIRESKSSAQIMSFLMQRLADESIRKMYKIEILAERKLRGRIMRYFSILTKKAGNGVFNVHMDREQLARFLCVNRSALSYELNEMKREGMIDFRKNEFRMLGEWSKKPGSKDKKQDS